MYILRSPECHSDLVQDIILDLLRYPNSSIIPNTINVTGFDDFILLSSANKLIEDVSTYSYWAGIFSSATEKHVNAQYHSMPFLNKISPDLRRKNYGYIYHDTVYNNYFGKLQPNGIIIYDYHIPPTSSAIPINIHHHHNNSHNFHNHSHSHNFHNFTHHHNRSHPLHNQNNQNNLRNHSHLPHPRFHNYNNHTHSHFKTTISQQQQ